MSGLRLPRHRRAKLFALTTAGVALALALLAGCPAGDRTSSTLRVLHAFGGADGAWPRGSLVAAGGFLYGGTTLGGNAKSGTVFRLRPDGTGFQSLYSFTAGKDNGLGNQPHHNSLLLIGDALVGAARQGGNTDNDADEERRRTATARSSGSRPAAQVIPSSRSSTAGSDRPRPHTAHPRSLPTAGCSTA